MVAASQGRYAIAVQITEEGGIERPLVLLGTGTIDTIAPTSDISQELENDTGAPNDLITSDSTVTVSGTASEAVQSVEIWDDFSDTMVGTATVDADGISWSFSGDLAEGSYQLYAKLTELASNVGQTTAQTTIVVDQTLPEIDHRPITPKRYRCFRHGFVHDRRPGFGDDIINGFDANPGGGQDLLDISGLGITAATFSGSVKITDLGSNTLVEIGTEFDLAGGRYWAGAEHDYSAGLHPGVRGRGERGLGGDSEGCRREWR